MNQMGEPKKIAGCPVLKQAPASKRSRYKVAICQVPDAEEGETRYVVWYIDDQGKPTGGRFYKQRANAQSEFERRTGSARGKPAGSCESFDRSDHDD